MLPYEVRKIVNMMIKQYIIFIICSMCIMIILNEIQVGVVFSLGLTLAILNFILSGVILRITIEKKNRIILMLIPFFYIVRISIVVLIGLGFAHEFKFISAYIIGFITYFPILIISWFKDRRLNKNGAL